MKICFCIPHYFKSGEDKDEIRYASHGEKWRSEKIKSLSEIICNTHLLFSRIHIGANHRLRLFEPVHNECADEVKINIITVDRDHLLDELSIPPNLYNHVLFSGDPEDLGYHAHKVFKMNNESYDYYCYLEDDIIIRDPHFFLKLDFFNKNFSKKYPNSLLQPNRYEYFFSNGILHHKYIHKIYSDLEYTENIKNKDIISINHLGSMVEFEKSRAHHSGCFFVNKVQLKKLLSAKNFGNPLDIDKTMKLDAAATIPISQAFEIYKTIRNNMNYFQVEHAVPKLFTQIKIDKNGDLLWNHPWNKKSNK